MIRFGVTASAVANLHTLYRRYATLYQRGELEPYQSRALETLKGWLPYGVEGPYPWKECLGYLDDWLARHDGEMPPLNLGNGGFPGLSASPMERMSGAFTCINQGDGKARKGARPGSGLTIAEDKQRDLDEVCKRYGLQWRKKRERLASGGRGEILRTAPKTCFQLAHQEFCRKVAAHPEKDDQGYFCHEFFTRHYNMYPVKHARQDLPWVVADRLAPERRAGKRASAARPRVGGVSRTKTAK